MATDAVIQFRYSDDVHLISIYKRYDSFPKEIINSLKKYLINTKNDQWDYMVSDIISSFVQDSENRKGIKILNKEPSLKANGFIYFYEIIPKEIYFLNNKIPLEISIHVNFYRGNKKKLIYSGSISEFNNSIFGIM